MKSILLSAVVILPIAASLVSCSSTGSTSTSNLRILSTEEIAALAKNWTGTRGGLPAEPSIALREASAALPKDKHGMPTYELKHRTRLVRTTAYSCAENEPGAYGNLNAAGTTLKYGQVRSAAADWSHYPVGTTFKIKGLPYTYVVDDYGSALAGTNTVDIYHPTLRGMNHWGTRQAEIVIVHWGSWERTANLLKGRTKHAHCAQMYAGVQRRIRNGEIALRSTTPAPSL